MAILKKIFCFCLVVVSITATAQTFRYQQAIFDSIDTIKDVEYAQAEWLNNPISVLSEYNIHDGENKTESRPLYMDIFLPHVDTCTKRPAIIFSHSGAFLKGSRHSDDMMAFCDSLAHHGYVTATIDYRLGMGAKVSRVFGVIVGLSVDEENAERAGYRATQDSRAAIRFLKQNSEVYGIDSSKIFMVGSSAGAVQAISTLYLDKETELPPGVGLSPDLGNLDQVGIIGPSSKPAAVVAMWGANWNTSQIENEFTPLFLIHGEDDNIVPFKKGVPLEGVVPDNPLVYFNMPETYGSYCIDTALVNRGIPHRTYFVKGQKHEFYGVDTGMFPEEGPNQYWDTINHKINDFLFEQFQPEAEFELQIEDNLLITQNNSTDAENVFWNFGDGTSSREFEPEHLYENTGIYQLTLKVCNKNLACDTVSQEVKIDRLTEIAEQRFVNLVTYPNPVSNYLSIRGIPSTFDLRLFNLTGQIQLQFNNFTESQIDLSSLHAGMYVLEIRAGQNIFVRKISKID